MKRRSTFMIPFPLIGILLTAWALLIFRLDAPWFGAQDSYRVWVASAVRNYDLYGLEATRLMIVRDSGPVTPDQFYIYSHHPPLIAWMPYAITRLVGYHELGVRYGFACVTLIGVAALYVLTRRLYGVRVGLWASTFYAFVPMTAYFGRVVGHDPIGMMAALLYAAVLVNWLRRPNRARFSALVGLVWLAVWSAWPAVFFVGTLGGAAFWFGRRTQKMAVIGLAGVSLVAFAVLMIFYQAQWSGSIESILEAFVWRTGDESHLPGSERFTLIEFFSRLMAHLLFYSTPSLVILAVVGLLALRRHGTLVSNSFLLALFLAGLGYQFVFRNASYIHDYYKFFLVPSLAVLAALAWVHLRPDPRYRRVARPVMDALLIMMMFSGLGIWGLLHLSGRQPMIQTLIDTLNARLQADDFVIGYIASQGYDRTTGYDRVIEFYTYHNIEWDVPPAAAVDLAQAQDGGRVVYLYCADEDAAPVPALATYSREAIVQDRCWWYDLSLAENSSEPG